MYIRPSRLFRAAGLRLGARAVSLSMPLRDGLWVAVRKDLALLPPLPVVEVVEVVGLGGEGLVEPGEELPVGVHNLPEGVELRIPLVGVSVDGRGLRVGLEPNSLNDPVTLFKSLLLDKISYPG